MVTVTGNFLSVKMDEFVNAYESVRKILSKMVFYIEKRYIFASGFMPRWWNW